MAGFGGSSAASPPAVRFRWHVLSALAHWTFLGRSPLNLVLGSCCRHDLHDQALAWAQEPYPTRRPLPCTSQVKWVSVVELGPRYRGIDKGAKVARWI